MTVDTTPPASQKPTGDLDNAQHTYINTHIPRARVSPTTYRPRVRIVPLCRRHFCRRQWSPVYTELQFWIKNTCSIVVYLFMYLSVGDVDKRRTTTEQRERCGGNIPDTSLRCRAISLLKNRPRSVWYYYCCAAVQQPAHSSPIKEEVQMTTWSSLDTTPALSEQLLSVCISP